MLKEPVKTGASQAQSNQVVEVVKCVWLEKHFDQYFYPLLDVASQECDYWSWCFRHAAAGITISPAFDEADMCFLNRNQTWPQGETSLHSDDCKTHQPDHFTRVAKNHCMFASISLASRVFILRVFFFLYCSELLIKKVFKLEAHLYRSSRLHIFCICQRWSGSSIINVLVAQMCAHSPCSRLKPITTHYPEMLLAQKFLKREVQC